MARSRAYEVGVGCLFLAALVAFGLMALRIGAIGGLGAHVDVTARFHDASGLEPGAAVTVAGVEIGTVDALALDAGTAVAHLSIDPDAGVGKDARVRIRMRSLLGEKYVEIVPGAPGVPAAADGDVLAVDREQMDVDALLAKMAPMLDAVDPEVLGRVVGQISARLDEDPERVGRMLYNADRMLANGAAASDDFDDLIGDGRATMSDARATMRELDARAEQVEPVIARADRVLGDLEEVADGLPELTAKIENAVGETTEWVASLEETQHDVRVVLKNLSEIDKWEIRRMLREEGVLVRLRAREVDPESDADFKRRGRTR